MSILTNLVAYYKTDTGALTTDTSGNSKTLTNTNTVGEGTGVIGTCADFSNANTNKILKINDAIRAVGDATTVSFWVKPYAAPATGTNWNLVGGMNGQASGTYHGVYYSKLSGGQIGLTLVANSSAFYAITLPTTSWTHIVYTLPNATGTRYLYVNGNSTAVASDAGFTGSYAAYGAWFNIGGRVWTGISDLYASVQIDEVAMWTRVLTATEISYLYNFNGGRQYPLSNIMS